MIAGTLAAIPVGCFFLSLTGPWVFVFVPAAAAVAVAAGLRRDGAEGAAEAAFIAVVTPFGVLTGALMATIVIGIAAASVACWIQIALDLTVGWDAGLCPYPHE